MKKIGFIGLGAMARPFIATLISEGFEVYGYDLMPAAQESFEKSGGIRASSPADLAEKVDIAISLLPYAESVEEAVLGIRGLVEGAKAGLILVEGSTIDPGTILKLERKVEKHGIRMLDMGIAASPGMARIQKGTLLLGGKAEDLAACEAELKALVKNGRVLHTGKLGSGKIMKLINNYVGGIQVVALSEAFNLARASGIDLKIAYDAMRGGMANCWALNIRPPYPGIVEKCPANDNYEPDFSVDYIAKDMAYAMQAAEQVSASMLFGATALQYYRASQNRGEGKQDFSAVVHVVEQLSRSDME